MTVVNGTATLTDRSTGLSASLSAPFAVGAAAPRFGMNYDIDGGLPAAATTLGCKPFTTAKVFNSSPPSSYPGHSIPSSVTHPLATIKVILTTAAPWISSSDQSALAAIFTSMPKTGVPMVTINQEGEADRFGYTAAQVAGSHLTAYNLFKAHAPANAVYCQDFQTYTASSGSKGPAGFSKYICCAANGQVDLPLYLMDWYPSNTTTDAVASVTPMFNAIRALLPRAPVGIAECNWIAGNGAYHGPGTDAQWFTDAWAWAVANDCTCFLGYFLNAHNTPWPPDSATLAELSAIAHASGL